ncbi:NAD(P)H-dependent glycerol-3-phosphate dehydrogenase [Nostocoides sp. F2B08]|uniref:NAD(P)H-dependent glycerol-3-phosphate dehydrogenase n=1 Tax=Nostocoides sp. F2B08 TaxID=2653936 RepID=UPI00126376FA|nr:NAD(P)H-dependent glycerol-3-phosphate dehydrogenase [Tetrasphaera sp. F2B08]KAB7746075.1 NAD(P)H-dependent glycerol-3-phosphate dehydrogenase [Tetrasphaera sp. F2B08]
MTQVAVFGTGSWGTAFACVLADAGSTVRMWGRRQDAVEQINAGVNTDYLPGVPLPRGITASSDPEEVTSGAEIVVLAVPSQSLRDNLADWGSAIPHGAAVVSLMKGVELGTTMRMSEVIVEAGAVAPERVAVVSGPNLAREIVARQPAASVVACIDHDTADLVAAACHTPYFRPYTHEDVVGAELGGATKNVIALAVGMAEGLGMGDNTKASIITRGLAETTRLGVRLGGDPMTFAGLAGVGDLIATCMSPLSRNHTFGVQLGQGFTVEEVVSRTRQTAEGVKSCASILQLAHEHGVDVPIIEQVNLVVHEGHDALSVGQALMARERGREVRH